MNECLRAWVAAAAGAEVSRCARLRGSTSSILWQMEAGGRRLVLRVHNNRDWLQQEPDLVAREGAALNLACSGGLPAPEPVAMDEEGTVCGAPLLLMTWLPGEVSLRPADLDDWLRQQARTLLDIHRLPAGDFGWTWCSWAPEDPVAPAWSEVPGAWERAIEVIAGPAPSAPTCFIHRDYHPVNLLWRGDRLSAVVDWVNACRGSAAADLAHCRGNLSALYGIETADRFLRHYREAGGGDEGDMAWWDLMSLIEGLPGPPEVYPGWVQFGVRHVTPGLLRALADARLLDALRRLP